MLRPIPARHDLAQRLLLGITLAAAPAALPGQFGANYQGAPIHYGTHKPNDLISRLQQRIEDGAVQLAHNDRSGYLPALLDQLGISTTTQTLVFSKTSFQIRKIAPHSPRALYFSDEVYIGFVPGGKLIEITAMDARRGPIFYTLGQQKVSRPTFQRRTHDCLNCHGSSRTDHWPGHLVRSVYTKPSGDVVTRVGSFLTTQASPFEERWGGWYVTGKHGRMRHMGNSTVIDRADDMAATTGASRAEPVQLNLEPGANLIDLSDRFATDNYLTPHSDIVALLVLEHQTKMQNLVSRASYEVRAALHRQRDKNRLLELPDDQLDANTLRIIREAASRVLEYMLCKHEVDLPDPVEGSSDFATTFSARGPRDAEGRSLYQLDLKTRLLRYPCSYVIYSPSFDAMPQRVLDRVYLRLWRILTGKIGRRSWRLTRDQRQAILDILLATKRGLPDYFVATRVR